MHKMKHIHMFIVIMALILAFYSCRTDIGRTARSAVDDAAIGMKITQKFFKDPVVNMFDIKVVSNKGVVTLTGKVNTYKEKGRAKRLALSVRGVREVRNKIIVR